MAEERPRINAADAAQAERLHTFAHDIKNRLGGLWEALRLCNELPPGPEREELAAFAERSFFGAQREVEQLLDEFAVPRGFALKDPLPLDARALLDEALRGEEHRLKKKEQVLRIAGSIARPIMGDAHWLDQLLRALISNASKFSARGAVIDIALSEESGMAVLRVVDHGVGMNGADLADVFTRFALLASRSTSGEPQMRGTLARARQWAGAHGGTLTAHSDGPGTGSVFELRLPLAVD